MFRILGSSAILAALLSFGLGVGRPQTKASRELSGVWSARYENRSAVAGTIRRLGPEGTFYQPMMHPDGTKVVFWGKESKDLNVKKFNIWVCNIDNTNCRQLTGDDESEGPSWSLDGKHIVYTRWIGKGMGKVWIMDADGSNKRALTTGPGEDARPFMSPDGRTVVFASNRSGRFYLYRTDINGAEPIQITFSDTQKDFRPAFSWDGRSLAFYRHVPGASRTIAIMKFPDGKPTIPFFMKAGEGFFHGAFWSRDGRHVLAHGRRGELSVRLYLIEVATGKMEPVMVPGFRAWGHGSWDRDMKVMAFDGTRVLAGVSRTSPAPARCHDAPESERSYCGQFRAPDWTRPLGCADGSLKAGHA